MSKPFCHHRISCVKKYQIGDQWFVITRCRRCDKWERRKIDISADASRMIPTVKREQIVEELEHTSTPQEQVDLSSSDTDVKQ
jgi:hypothetical protein